MLCQHFVLTGAQNFVLHSLSSPLGSNGLVEDFVLNRNANKFAFTHHLRVLMSCQHFVLHGSNGLIGPLAQTELTTFGCSCLDKCFAFIRDANRFAFTHNLRLLMPYPVLRTSCPGTFEEGVVRMPRIGEGQSESKP